MLKCKPGTEEEEIKTLSLEHSLHLSPLPAPASPRSPRASSSNPRKRSAAVLVRLPLTQTSLLRHFAPSWRGSHPQGGAGLGTVCCRQVPSTPPAPTCGPGGSSLPQEELPCSCPHPGQQSKREAMPFCAPEGSFSFGSE